MRSLGVWFLGFGFLISPSATAQEARLHISADSVFVGERFELRVAVEHAVGSTAVFQEVPEGDPEAGPLLSFGDAEVFSARRLPPMLDGAVRVDSIVFEGASFTLDNAVIGPVLVDLIAGGDTSIVRSNTVTLPVRSVLPAGEAEIQPPGPPASFPRPLWAWVLLAIGVLIVAALLIWLWRRSREKSATMRPRPAPYPEATRRLNALTLPKSEPAIKPFYIELSDLLRTYLSRTLSTPALELTTSELANALASDTRVPELAVKKIRGTLRVADLVKFADMHPESEAHATAIEKTREAVELSEAVVHPPEIPENGMAGNGVQKTESGGRREEDGGPKTEDGGQRTEDH